MKHTLFNGNSNNCCGYCQLHHCSITVKQMRVKECLSKQCRHLAKYEEHPYWIQRESMKQKRKDRKRRIDKYVAAVSA